MKVLCNDNIIIPSLSRIVTEASRKLPGKMPTGNKDRSIVRLNFSMASNKLSSIIVMFKSPVVFPANKVTL